ncbi:DUF1800 domain-containing protein [Plantactinospora endophytica]|uniref:DUF1800 domain-containing protein n=1 Tax=Plantactinospora endophytica TaxID=673535 RepID=A0ABQ4DSY3_9ACTN|nr:DUF1800 domain-containing protein [Plantactinospora endophytica]GIG85545.1 hypothetical protein Pen02_04810 [Plantactinospora endophytica]
MVDRDAVVHLLRRATFGPTAAEVDAAERAGLAGTLDRLLAPVGADPGAAATPAPDLGADPYAGIGKDSSREQRQQAQKQRAEQARGLVDWWLDRMVAAEHQLTEKLVFFWHGHWATSVRKVRSAQLMLGQLDTFRRYGRGPFEELVRAMVRDPALILWLDGQKNSRTAPNENLARELMELFTLGIGHYTEAHVKAGARALTGWQVDRRTGKARFVRRRHDPAEKTILGRTEAFDADSYARLLAARPESAAFVAARLWARFAGTDVPPPEPLSGANGGTIEVLRAVLTAPSFAQTRGGLVKQPVEWAVGAMRQLGIRPGKLPDQQRRELVNRLAGMDQVPLRPPSVGGWPAGPAWLTTSSLQSRMRLAALLANAAPAELTRRLAAAPRDDRPAALARLLVVDRWTPRTRAALTPLADDPRRLLVAGLVSPEYTVC